jgi:transposase
MSAKGVAYVGEGKTDAKDAYLIAETARLRRDLAVIDADTDLVRNLAVLTGHRADLIADRMRMINRLRDLMTCVFPSLERAFDYSSHKGLLVLLTGYSSPDRIRRPGESLLAGWLRQRKVRDSSGVAARAVAAAKAHLIALPGQDLTADIITELATNILTLDQRLKKLDAQIDELFQQRPQAAIIQSMPGFGPFLGASLLVGAGDLRAFPSAGHLAAAAGLVPVPNDSGRRTGNLHRPLRYSRPLRHVFYLSAQTSMMRAGPNRDYYLKKRPRSHSHPGRHRPRPTPCRRPLGADAREPDMDRRATDHRSRGLTTTLRFPMPGHRPVLDLCGSFADQHLRRDVCPGLLL